MHLNRYRVIVYLIVKLVSASLANQIIVDQPG